MKIFWTNTVAWCCVASFAEVSASLRMNRVNDEEALDFEVALASQRMKTKSSKSKKSGKSKSKKSSLAPSAAPSPDQSQSTVFDINGDDVEDSDDLILVLRGIDDPDREFSPGQSFSDVNQDGIVNFADAIDMIFYLETTYGPAVVAPLTLDSITSNFDWDAQGNLQRRRKLQAVAQAPNKDNFVKLLRDQYHRNLQQCGQSSFDIYTKGAGPKPTITWDSGFPRDPSVEATASDYYNWAYYGTGLNTYGLTIPDGARAYRRYRANTGAVLTIDYNRAYNGDSGIRAGVDAEIERVKNAVKQLHDGEEGSFQFHSTDARLLGEPSTENWQKALGGHRYWSTGTVTYDSSACQLTIDLTINAEDFYNFNKGQQDIATGLPDNDNGRFEVLGWAKAFFSRGSLSRTVTVPLECCKDEDCGDATEFDCECSLCTTQCPTQQTSGGQGFTSFSVNLMKTNGTFEVFYQMYTIPDELTVIYEGSNVFSTGGLVSGSRTVPVAYGSSTSTSTTVTVEINAPNSGTAWDVAISCPP